MDSKILRQMGHAFGFLEEKCLELVASLRNLLRRADKGYGNLTETYSFKLEYMNKEYVSDFLKSRIRIAGTNRYRIAIDSSFSSEKEDEIGSVTLTCRGRYIDHALLIAGPATSSDNRLIYWKFNQ